MSYDITNWKTKRLEGFQLPLKMLVKDYYVRLLEENHIRACCNIFEIEGRLNENFIAVDVTKINIVGNGSDRELGDFLELLSQSTGILEAVIVWTYGDEFSKIICTNGVIREEEIDL